MLIDLSLCSSQVAELQNIVIPEMSGSEQAAFTHFSRNLKSRTNYKPQNPKMKDMVYYLLAEKCYTNSISGSLVTLPAERVRSIAHFLFPFIQGHTVHWFEKQARQEAWWYNRILQSIQDSKIDFRYYPEWRADVITSGIEPISIFDLDFMSNLKLESKAKMRKTLTGVRIAKFVRKNMARNSILNLTTAVGRGVTIDEYENESIPELLLALEEEAHIIQHDRIKYKAREGRGGFPMRVEQLVIE